MVPGVLHGLRNCTSASQPSQIARKLWSCVTCAITQHADKSVRSTWLTMVQGRALKRRWNFLVLVDVDAVDCPAVLQVPFVPRARDGLKESYRAWIILTPHWSVAVADSTSSTARSGLRDDAYAVPSVKMLVVHLHHQRSVQPVQKI